MRFPLSLCAAVLAAMTASAEAPEPSAVVAIEVEGTEFIFRRADGSALPRAETVGAVLTVKAPGGEMRVRIDRVWTDPKDVTGEVVLYALSVQDEGSGEWKELCAPDAEGQRAGFPLSGSWTADGRHLRTPDFSLACTSGAQGKCVRYGYKPWKQLPDGTSLWEYHQACTRMVRADYCGNGTSHTRDGTLINLYDRLGIQRSETQPGLHFEAGWGPDGAVCVRRTRLPEVLSPKALREACPRLVRQVGKACSERAAEKRGALLLNES